MIRVFAVLGLALWMTCSAVAPAWAHRVNIFAYVEGSEILVECSFSRSQKVKQGKIEVRDAVTNAVVAQGKTDNAGVFRFAVTPEMRRAGHDLLVRIAAGEGHQNDWTIAASEFAAAAPAQSAPAAPSAAPAQGAASPAAPAHSAAPHAAQSVAAPAQSAAPSAPASASPAPPASPALTAADVERIVGVTMDAKLAPLKHMLASQVEAGPTLKDIVGGIGWIFGLVGVAAYFRRRP